MRRLVLATAFSLALVACGSDSSGTFENEDGEEIGTYDVDAATGETTARITDEDGNVTTMRSGENVPVSLPDGFSLYPGAKVLNNVKVARNGGEMVLLSLQSEDPPSQLVGFYRKQAEAAGVDIQLELDSGPMSMIGGEGPDGMNFSFTASQETDFTNGQLTIGEGME